MDLVTLVSIFFFYLLILLTGIWASRKAKEKNSNHKSSEEMFLAGRRVPLWVGALTMTATWVGGGYINGTAESVYSSGLVWTHAPWGYALSLILGGLFFAKTMRERKYTTLLDPFQEKYGSAISSLLFIPALIGDIFWTSAILTALGYTFAILLGLDFNTAIIFSSAVAIAYTFLGGLWSVAYTDVIQLIFIFVGLCLAVPYAMDFSGGANSVLSFYQEHFKNDSGFIPKLDFFTSLWSTNPEYGAWDKQIWYWLDLALLLMLGGIPWGVYFQRVLACPTPELARKLSFTAGFACFLMALPAIAIGMVGLKVDWSVIGSGQEPDGAMILPYVLKYCTPKWVSVIGLSAVAAAVMSSVDSSILSSASMFAWNLYRPFAKKCTDHKMLIVTKISILVVGVLATLLALKVKSVYSLWFLCSDLVYVLLFPQLVMVLFYKQSNRQGALVGFIVGGFFRLGAGEASLGVPAFISYPMFYEGLGLMFPFRTFAMLASMLAIVLGSYLFNLLSEFQGTSRESF